jgi:hypothetical protein
MNKSITHLLKTAAIAVIASAGLIAAPARAEGFEPKDGRVDPSLSDRVAVYCKDEGVEVWGLDGNLSGLYLTTFSTAELASGAAHSHTTDQGTVTLTQVKAATTFTSYADETDTTLDTFVEASAEYTIAWSGGAHGADGAGAFSKTFECTYLP